MDRVVTVRVGLAGVALEGEVDRQCAAHHRFRLAEPVGSKPLATRLGLAATQIPSAHKLREAAEAFDAIANWPISFRYPADDPMQAEPLPETSELSAWVQRIEVASLVTSRPS